MTSDQICKLLGDIGAESSKNAKIALIAAHIADPDFQVVLYQALNPFITYGIADIPEKQFAFTDREFGEHTWTLVSDLQSRNLTGNAARNAVQEEMNKLTPASGELLRRILKKDLRAGFSETSVNKVKPNFIPVFDCMLAHPFEEKRVKKWPQAVEPKLDGVRVLAFVSGGPDKGVKFYSRSGKEFTTFDALKQPILDAADACGWGAMHFVLDGEVVSGSFNKTVSEVRRSSAQATDAHFHIFDLLPRTVFSENHPSKRTYTERRKLIEGLVGPLPKDGPLKLLPRYLVNSVAEIHSLYESVRARGLEGLIVKDPDALYVLKRSHAWMKIKAEESVDVEIVGFEEGTGKYEGKLGALVVNHKGVRVNVGSGLSDSQRESFWADQSMLTGRLCEVEYHEITPDGSLRHPRFKRFRDDKAVSHD